MVFDPFMIVMLALVAVLIFFMFRNGKKRQQALAELQSNMRPGAEVMLQSGIYGTIEDIDEEENRVTLRSGSTTLVVHRNAIAQVVTPVDAPDDEIDESLAPDDDPAFGQRIAGLGDDKPSSDSSADGAEDDKPKA